MNATVGVNIHCDINPTADDLVLMPSSRAMNKSSIDIVSGQGVGKFADGHSSGCPSRAASDL